MTLTTVRSNRTVTIPKQARDNLGLMPLDWIEFDADDRSTFVNRLGKDAPSINRQINEAAPKYDLDRTVTSVSASAEIVIPEAVFESLMVEEDSIIGFFRDEVGYRVVPIYNPSQYGRQTLSMDDGGIQIVHNSIMEYSVAISREARAELYYGWENANRLTEQDPFTDVMEPERDAILLDRLTKSDPAFLS